MQIGERKPGREVQKVIDHYTLEQYGDGYPYDASCYYDGKQWIILLRMEILVIDAASNTIFRVLDLSGYYGQFFELYPYRNHFIVYGEQEILRLSENLDILWSFSGKDIFIRPDNLPAFSMQENEIILYDWLGNCYHVSYDGRLHYETAI